jgi:hypothetical protein
MRLLVPEIFDKIQEHKTDADKVAWLQKNKDNKLMMYVLALNFDPQYVFDLPKGNPPYTRSPHPVAMAETNLYAENRRFYLLLKGNPRRPANIKTIQVENIFIQILEGINGIEADMMIALKDKALQKKYKGLTEGLVRRAFPEMLPEKQANPA